MKVIEVSSDDQSEEEDCSCYASPDGPPCARCSRLADEATENRNIEQGY